MSAVVEDPELERARQDRDRQPLHRRRAIAEAILSGLFVIVATTLALAADAMGDFSLGQTAALVAMFALGIRIRIDVGVAYTSPVQLAFVPMLLLLPTPYVPLFVLLGWFLGRLPDLLGSNPLHPDRLLIVPTDCWFSLGPALVLVAGDAQMLDWDKWPVYLAALGAQFAGETISTYAREWLGEGSRPELVARELGVVWIIDTLLAPLGLLAAFASASFDYAFMLLAPPAFLLALYARERTRRLESAFALADAARDRQDLIAGASHELVTPLAVMVGLTHRLTSGGEISQERRAEVDTVMRREVLALRQIVRQFVDYTRIKTERGLQLRSHPIALEPVAREVALALQGMGDLRVTGPPVVPDALVDPDRAHQMVMSMAAEALDGTAAAALMLDATETTVTVTLTSPAPLRERPFGEGGEGSSGGLGLYVTRELARQQGGDATAEQTAEGGARYVLTLPRA